MEVEEPDLEELQAKVENTIETLRQLAVTTHKFEPASQNLVFDTINDVARQLREIDEAKHAGSAVPVPEDLLRFVDEGKNPELALRDAFETLARFSKSQQDVLVAFKNFKEFVIASTGDDAMAQ